MELTVQEIIAKVALQRESQLKEQYKQNILAQINNINNKPSSFDKKQDKLILYQKNPSLKKQNRKNPEKQDSQSLNQTILEEKYKALQKTYKKLKIQVQNQSKIDRLYSQVVKKLQTVINKNRKLQKELDLIRSRKTFLKENSQLSNQQQSQKRSKFYNLESISLQKKSIKKGRTQHSKQVQRSEHKQIQNRLMHSKENKDEKERISQCLIQYNKVSNSWCLNEISQYKQMIIQKEESIIKLNNMVEKQQKLINNYEKISEIEVSEKSIRKVNKNFDNNNNLKTSAKIEGTIVKVKRLGKFEDLSVKKDFTYRNMSNKNKETKHLNPLQIYMDQKTKKKIQAKIDKSRQGLLGIEESRYELGYVMTQSPYYEGQHGELNQTSEFICEV